MTPAWPKFVQKGVSRDLLRVAQGRGRDGVCVGFAYQRGVRSGQHLPQDDGVRAARRPLHGAPLSGNLSISQSIREMLQVERLSLDGGEAATIWNAQSMFDAARILGNTMRRVNDHDGPRCVLRASTTDVR